MMSASHISLPQSLIDTFNQQEILVVEDSALQQAWLCNWLRTFGIARFQTSADGHQALDIMQSSEVTPCTIILDLELPGMDGIELLQHLSELQIYPSIIVLSGADDGLISAVATMVEAMHFPLLGAFRKPVAPADLCSALEQYQQQKMNVELDQIRHHPSHQQLLQALDQQLIKPHFQPKLDLQQHCLAGVEALARWPLADGTFISPARFIPLAEQCGLIDLLTLTMLDQILQEMVLWRALDKQVPVALNLSALSLNNREMCNEILQRVQHSGEDPKLITFEITESALINDLPTALASISRLRLKGFGFSIDDYGTGFSSMQQLSRFPFTELKIDRSFVHRADQREHLRSILQSAIDMGRRLGITTVAEGVETQEELQLLQTMGCRHAQGYWIARPMAAEMLLDWLDKPLQTALLSCRD